MELANGDAGEGNPQIGRPERTSRPSAKPSWQAPRGSASASLERRDLHGGVIDPQTSSRRLAGAYLDREELGRLTIVEADGVRRW